MKTKIIVILLVISMVAGALYLVSPAAASILTNSPSSTSPSTGGWTNPANAYLDDSSYAISSSLNSQTYLGYGFNIPSGSTISLVRVKLDAWSATNDRIKLEVSNDGGSTFLATADTSGNLPTTQTTRWVVVTSWTTWTSTQVNSIATKVTHIQQGGTDNIYLDCALVEVTYTVETTVPSVAVTSPSADGSWTNNLKPSLSGTAGDTGGSGLSKVEVQIDGTGGWLATTTSDGYAHWSFTPVNDLTAGTRSFVARATDGAGNTATATRTIKIETTAPTLSIHAPSGFIATTAPTIQVSASDTGGSGISSVSISIDGGGSHAATLNGAYYEYAASGLAQGAHTVTATAIDAASNSATSSPATGFTVDSVSPSSSASVSGAYQSSRTFSVSFTTSDATSSVTSVQLYYRYGTSGSFSATGSSGSGTSGSISFTATQDGVVQFYTRATDSASNVEAAPVSPAFDDSTTIDSVGPTVVISSPSAGFVHVVAVPVSGTASAGSGIVNVQWQVDSTAGSWTIATGTTSWSFTTATLGQGAHTINVKATDGAGNTQTTSVAITVQSIFAITVTQSLHGTIAPRTTDVNYDGSQDFTITPESGYHIASVTVDDSPAAATSPYAFSHVTATHTITASFAPDEINTKLTVFISPTTYDKNNPQTINIHGVLTDSNSNPLTGQTLTLWYNDGQGTWVQIDSTSTIHTIAGGLYSHDWQDYPTGLQNGFYVIEARFALNTPYQPTHADTNTTDNGLNLNVLPEYIFGGLAAIGACFVGFVAFKKRSSLPHFKRL